MESTIPVVCSNVPSSQNSVQILNILNVVFGGQDANVIISQPCGVNFVQSEMDFAAVASETVKFTEMYIMEAKKA